MKDGVWQFDAKQGNEQVLDRRIGRNELAAIKVCLAYVDAQREYATLDRDGNGLLEYAQKMVSTAGTHDGTVLGDQVRRGAESAWAADGGPARRGLRRARCRLSLSWLPVQDPDWPG
jgi:hypothetical protein